jgi:hypothetical protein
MYRSVNQEYEVYIAESDGDNRRRLGDKQVWWLLTLLNREDEDSWLSLPAYRPLMNAIADHNSMRATGCRPGCPLPATHVVVRRRCECRKGDVLFRLVHESELKMSHRLVEEIVDGVREAFEGGGAVLITNSTTSYYPGIRSVGRDVDPLEIEVGKRAAEAVRYPLWVSIARNLRRARETGQALLMENLSGGEVLDYVTHNAAFCEGVPEEADRRLDPQEHEVAVFGVHGWSVFDTLNPTLRIAVWLSESATWAKQAAEGNSIIGLRFWSLDYDGPVTLRGSFGAAWTSPRLTATCDKLHSAPDSEHTCGIYAILRDGVQPELSSAGFWRYGTPTFGLVSCSGKVIVHERGVRSRHATCRLLIVSDEDKRQLILANLPAWRETRVLTYDEALRAIEAGLPASELMK